MIRHQDRDRFIVQLYKDGKSYRQIAQLARVSVRDIKPILKEYGAENATEYPYTNGEIVDSDSLMPISSRAYKLFAEEFIDPLNAGRLTEGMTLEFKVKIGTSDLQVLQSYLSQILTN